MDEITQDEINPQTKRELTSPLSPKRPRTDCTMTINHGLRSTFAFPELLTFCETIGSPSSTSMLQKSLDLVCTAEYGNTEDEKAYGQQDTKLNPITNLSNSQTNNAHFGSPESYFITAERHFLILVKDEQPPQSDKLSSYWVDDAGAALAESHTSKDASTDTSSHPDCKRLAESLEPSGSCNLPAGNDEDGRQVQIGVSQIQVFTHRASDKGVRCWSDCIHKDILHDTGLYNTWSQSAEVEEHNQKRIEHGFSENTLFSKEKEEGNSPMSSSDYTDPKFFYSNPEEEDPSGDLAGGIKSENIILELQICENENVAVCDEDKKSQVNENGLSTNSIPSAAQCAEGSIVSYVILGRNITTENGSLEAEAFCGAMGEHAAGKMIAKARSEIADHTTETPMPARISQEPAEGDNDAGPFSVIDPAIWSETDRETEEKRCNTDSTAGAELSPSVKVYKMEMLLPLCSDVRASQEVSALDQTWHFNHQSKTQQPMDEKEDLCQSYTEAQDCSISTNQTHNKTDNEGSCLWKSSPSSSVYWPAKCLPAGAGRQENHDTVGIQLIEQGQSCSFPVSRDHMKTQELEYLHNEIARMDVATEMRRREEITSFIEEIRADENGKTIDLGERFLQPKERDKEETTAIFTVDYKNSWTKDEITYIDEKLGNNLECLSDHPYSAVIPMTGGKMEENERKEGPSVREAIDVQGNSELLVSNGGDQHKSQQRGEVTHVSGNECVSEWTEDNMRKSGNKSALVSQHQQANRLSCFSDNQHKVEPLMVENKGDLLTFTFAATSDAVVPGLNELTPSQNADNNPTALTDRFYPIPCALTFCDRAPGGFDTFEKIQLSLEDDDDAGLSNSPLVTSLPGQLLKTPQQQLHHSMPEAESNKHEEAPEKEEGEEEVERFERHTENIANGFLNSDYSCNELPNFISAAGVAALGWPEQQPYIVSACNSSECFLDDVIPQSLSLNVSSKSHSPASDVSHSPGFEMKKQFDRVLKELKLFFNISLSDFAGDSKALSPEQCSDETDALEDVTSNSNKEQLSSPEQGHNRATSSDDADEGHSPPVCGGDPVVSCTSGSSDGEQEVPLGSRLCQETFTYAGEKCREPLEMEQKRKMWSPSFRCQPFLEELNRRPPEKRLHPLRTCTRPIRVGLSKRAKTKNLHHPHPYK